MTDVQSEAKEEIQTAKILSFPKDRIVREIPTGVVEEAVSRREREQIEEIIHDIISSLFSSCLAYGIDYEKEEFVKGFSYIAELTRALILRDFGMDHELQEILQETIKVLSDEEVSQMKKEYDEGVYHDMDEEDE